MCVYANELRKYSHFYILKLLFLSIFCWYFRYFVGNNDMLVGLHVPTNFQMYGQNSEKNLPPPPPPGYANAYRVSSRTRGRAGGICDSQTVQLFIFLRRPW